MIRVADLLPPGLDALAPPAPLPADAAVSSWFDDGALSAPRIGADPGPASRGLGVAQHADRVLGHLLREPDEGV